MRKTELLIILFVVISPLCHCQVSLTNYTNSSFSNLRQYSDSIIANVLKFTEIEGESRDSINMMTSINSTGEKSLVAAHARPLIILNEIPLYTHSILRQFSLSHVESIAYFLSDNATSIYGDAAADGIIIIKVDSATHRKILRLSNK